LPKFTFPVAILILSMLIIDKPHIKIEDSDSLTNELSVSMNDSNQLPKSDDPPIIVLKKKQK
jgi:hypothetical protein